MVKDKIILSWKVVVWVILDVHLIHRFIFISIWLVIIKFEIHIAIMLIISMIYESTYITFWCEDVL